MQIFHDVDSVRIPFNPSWKNVAVSVSGGADSALLAFLVCSLVTTQAVHIISHKRMWKTRPWQSYDSLTVFSWLLGKFPNIKFIRHTNFVAPDIEYGNTGPIIKDEYGKMVSGDNAQIRAYSEYVCFNENADVYYNAVTCNPRDIDLGGMHERDIEFSGENAHLEYMIHMGRVVSHPFRFVDKSWVLRQYRRLEIMDLFDITRSCEGEFSNIDYTNYKEGQSVPICNNCFWCKEREWAIEQSK
jgi:hypothetical protein